MAAPKLDAAELKAFNALLAADRKSNDELTELQRVAITAFVLAGRSYREAGRAFGCSPGAVTKTLQRFRTARSFASVPRKGRPEKLSEEEKQAVVARSCADPRDRPTYRELSGQLDGRVSLQTIKRVVRKARLADQGK